MTLLYTKLHYTARHYTPYPTAQLQLQLGLRGTNYTTLPLQLDYTTAQLQLQLRYTTLHPAVVVRWLPQPLQPLQKTQFQTPFGPSVDWLCHPWFTTANLSYTFPIFETSATASCGTTGIYLYHSRSIQLHILFFIMYLQPSVMNTSFHCYNLTWPRSCTLCSKSSNAPRHLSSCSPPAIWWPCFWRSPPWSPLRTFEEGLSSFHHVFTSWVWISVCVCAGMLPGNAKKNLAIETSQWKKLHKTGNLATSHSNPESTSWLKISMLETPSRNLRVKL